MVPSLTLHDGVEIPQLGFGVFQVPPEDTQRVVEEALAAGYRHIDTAAAYRNEKGVGAAIAASGIPREEVFVTTKLWNEQQGFDSALATFEKSLGRLGMDYVDLYLIHWPVPTQDRFVDTWRAFERIREEGGARTIGVSNFRIEDLERLERETDDRADRQPGRAAPPVPADRAARLARRAPGSRPRPGARSARARLLGEQPIVEIAERHGRTPGAGDPALAPAARQRRHPQVGHARADPREHRALRLRARRRARWPRSGRSTPAGAPAPTRRPSSRPRRRLRQPADGPRRGGLRGGPRRRGGSRRRSSPRSGR